MEGGGIRVQDDGNLITNFASGWNSNGTMRTDKVYHTVGCGVVTATQVRIKRGAPDSIYYKKMIFFA